MPENSNSPLTQVSHRIDEDEIDLMDYVLAIGRRKWLVLSGAALCAAIALGIGVSSPKMYEATSALIIVAPKTTAAGEISPTVSNATFRALVENRSLAGQVVAEFKLGESPFRLTAQKFLNDCLTVEAVRDTNLVKVSVRLPAKDLVAKVANRYAALAEDLSQRLNQEEALRARDYIKSQVDQARDRLREAEGRLEQFRKTAQIELLRKDVDSKLLQRGALLQLLVDIQTEKARLTRAEEELASRTQIGTIRRTIDQDPALMEAAREAGAGQRALLGLQFKSEYVNLVYEGLEQVITASRAKLAGLEKQRTELIDVQGLNATKLAQLSQLYERETELSRLTTEFELAKKVYVDTAMRFEEARLQVVIRSAQLHIADAAWAPDYPVGRRVVWNAVFAFGAGFAMSVIGILFFDAVKTAAARRNR
jgi:polysaccharide biosynthesis transport protein